MAEPDPRELAMARTLIESLATAFQPARYQDPHREKVWEAIRARVAREEGAPAPEVSRVLDLMDALRQSVALAEVERARGAAMR